MEYQNIIDRISDIKKSISIKNISDNYKAISKDDILSNTFREGDIVKDGRTGKEYTVITTATKRIVKV